MKPEFCCFNENAFKHDKPEHFYVNNRTDEDTIKGLCYYCYRTCSKYWTTPRAQGQFYDTYEDAEVDLVARKLFGEKP